MSWVDINIQISNKRREQKSKEKKEEHKKIRIKKFEKIRKKGKIVNSY